MKNARFAASRIDQDAESSLVVFTEPKPQQTGTGLLTRYGEVATTSGSSKFKMKSAEFRMTFISDSGAFRSLDSEFCIQLPGRLTAGHRPLKASVVVRIHPRQPI